MTKLYNLGEVAEKLCITKRTVHFYTAEGLIVPAIPSEQGKNNKYSDENMERRETILILKKIGFSLNRAKSIIESKTKNRDKKIMSLIRLLMELQ